MSNETSRYFRNIRYAPIETILYKYSPTRQRECMRARAYLYVYQNNQHDRLLSMQSKQPAVNFMLKDVNEVNRYPVIQDSNAQPQGKVSVEFGYKRERYAIVIDQANHQDVREHIKPSSNTQKTVKIVHPKEDETTASDKSLSFIERMHKASQSSSPSQQATYQKTVKTPDVTVKTQKKEKETIIAIPKQQPSFSIPDGMITNKYIVKTIKQETNKFDVNNGSRLCIINNSNILIQFGGDFIKMYGITKKATVKIVHVMKFPCKNILKAVHLIDSTLIFMLMLNEPHSLMVFNLDQSITHKIDFKRDLDEPITDFILPKENYSHQALIVTQNSTYLFNINQIGLDGTSKCKLSPLSHKGNNFKVYNHSLHRYLAVSATLEFQLHNSFKEVKPFYKGQLPTKARSLQYSSRHILYTLGPQIEMIVFDNKCTEQVNIIYLELQPRHIDLHGLHKQQFSLTMFSSNRVYIVASMRNVLVLWKLDDVLVDDLVYELTAYDEVIDSFGCFSNDSIECIWVILKNSQRVEYLHF